MFRLRNKDAKFPELYPKVVRKLATTKDKGWDKVGDFTLRDKVDFMPQKGLQEKFCASECNLIFIGGVNNFGIGICFTAQTHLGAGNITDAIHHVASRKGARGNGTDQQHHSQNEADNSVSDFHTLPSVLRN